jgi:Transcriptional regulator containing an amidase domain and an AraC-type DNA-binding HTH domain
MKSFRLLGKLSLLLALITATTIAVRAGDGQARKDSLRSLIPTLEGRERLNVYEQLSVIYFGEISNCETVDSLLAVYDEIFALAGKLNDTIAQSRVKTNILVAYLNINEFDKVIELAPGHLAFIEKNETWDYFYSIAYRSYANAWLRKGDAEKAILIAREMYEHAREHNNDEGMAAAYAQIAVAYERTSRMDEAESYTRQAIDLLKNNEKMPDILPTYYFRLGNILRLQGRLDEALQVAHDCGKSVETLQQQSVRALPPTFHVNTWSLYSSVYAAMRDFDKSEAYLDKIDSLNVGSPIISKNSFRKRAKALEERGEYAKALVFIDKAYAIPPYLEDPTSNALLIKSSILARMGRIDESQQCITEMTAISDSLRSMDFNRQLDELRVAHEVDALTAEKELRLRQLLYSLSSCILLIIVLSVWIYYSRSLKKKNTILAGRILEQTKQYDLDKASHDIAATTDDDIFEQLERYMDEKKPYTDPALNRKTLSDALNTTERIIRELIKDKTGDTVSDYITSYRLKHANILFLKPDSELTIEGIALESGFGSRAAFYSCYRTVYGLSPSEFRKIINSNQRED